MKNVTATELARNLSNILDAVEHNGENFVISRNGRTVAELTPKKTATVARLREILDEFPPDPDFAKDIAEVRTLLYVEERDWTG